MPILFGACLVLMFAGWLFIALMATEGSATGDDSPWWFVFYTIMTLALIGMCHWADYVTIG